MAASIKLGGIVGISSGKLSPLQKVALAIGYVPDPGDTSLMDQLMSDVLRFVRIFRPTCQVHVRFADVKYDRHAYLSPASPPLFSDLLKEEKLLLRLRVEEKMTWHKLARHFDNPCSELYSVAGLQARYQRLKARQLQAEAEVAFLQRLKEILREKNVESVGPVMRSEAIRVKDNTL